APFELLSVEGPQRGRAAAINRALAVARGEVVITLDDDMEVVEGFVEHHRRHHTRDPGLCVLGPVPVRLNGESPRAAVYVQRKFDAPLATLAEPGHVYAPRDFYSGNASLRAETLRRIGGFDESFTFYGNEDIELWLRLRSAGTSLMVDPDAVAYQEYDKSLE